MSHQASATPSLTSHKPCIPPLGLFILNRLACCFARPAGGDECGAGVEALRQRPTRVRAQHPVGPLNQPRAHHGIHQRR